MEPVPTKSGGRGVVLRNYYDNRGGRTTYIGMYYYTLRGSPPLRLEESAVRGVTR